MVTCQHYWQEQDIQTCKRKQQCRAQEQHQMKLFFCTALKTITCLDQGLVPPVALIRNIWMHFTMVWGCDSGIIRSVDSVPPGSGHIVSIMVLILLHLLQLSCFLCIKILIMREVRKFSSVLKVHCKPFGCTFQNHCYKGEVIKKQQVIHGLVNICAIEGLLVNGRLNGKNPITYMQNEGLVWWQNPISF